MLIPLPSNRQADQSKMNVNSNNAVENGAKEAIFSSIPREDLN